MNTIEMPHFQYRKVLNLFELSLSREPDSPRNNLDPAFAEMKKSILMKVSDNSKTDGIRSSQVSIRARSRRSKASHIRRNTFAKAGGQKPECKSIDAMNN
jgi:hypothetical protein